MQGALTPIAKALDDATTQVNKVIDDGLAGVTDLGVDLNKPMLDANRFVNQVGDGLNNGIRSIFNLKPIDSPTALQSTPDNAQQRTTTDTGVQVPAITDTMRAQESTMIPVHVEATTDAADSTGADGPDEHPTAAEADTTTKEEAPPTADPDATTTEPDNATADTEKATTAVTDNDSVTALPRHTNRSPQRTRTLPATTDTTTQKRPTTPRNRTNSNDASDASGDTTRTANEPTRPDTKSPASRPSANNADRQVTRPGSTSRPVR